MNATSDYAGSNAPSAAGPANSRTGMRPLRRPVSDRMVGGVAAGVARSLGVDPIIVRVAFIVLAVMGGTGLALYLAGWLLIPDEESGQSVAAEVFRSLSAGRN
jgi:phage shock protein PspC (stress-responsive transcriptional regulator)